MFVKFESPAGASFAMPSDAAVALLKMMGVSGGVPGALSADDVPSALERLRRGIAEATPSADRPMQNRIDDKSGDEQAPPARTLRNRRRRDRFAHRLRSGKRAAAR